MWCRRARGVVGERGLVMGMETMKMRMGTMGLLDEGILGGLDFGWLWFMGSSSSYKGYCYLLRM